MAIPIGLAGAGLAIASAAALSASNAAFTATTQNGVNTFQTGTLHLSDNDANGLLFNATDINPGDTLTRCIRIIYDGDITTSHVKLYASAGAATNNLDQYLDLTITEGTLPGTPAFGDCTGFSAGTTVYPAGTVNDFRTTKTNFSTAVDDWAPTATNETRDFRFTYTFQTSAPNNLMASSATVTFTWESQAGS